MYRKEEKGERVVKTCKTSMELGAGMPGRWL